MNPRHAVIVVSLILFAVYASIAYSIALAR
jgi:hypothetical protein